MRFTFPGGPVFEADPLGGPAIGGQPVDSEPAAEPEPFAVSQNDWEQQQQATGFIMDQLEQLSRYAQAQTQDPNTIQLPEDSLLQPQDLEVISQLIAQQQAPFAETREQWMQTEGEQRAHDVIADDTAANGEFLFDGSQEKARALSENYYPDMAARYGQGPQAAEAAIRQACADTREWEAAVGKAYMEREQNQLSTLAGAPRSPAAPGRPAQQQLTTVEGGNEFDVLRKWFPNI